MITLNEFMILSFSQTKMAFGCKAENRTANKKN